MKKLLIVGALALTQGAATDCGQIIRDPGFDLWCGEELCTWKVVRGDVRRVGTWHEGDSGIELLGSDSAISQLTSVNDSDGTCIEFSLVANVEASAEVFLHVDVFGDGTIERSERVPTSNWKPVSFHVLVQAPYDGIRFELAKSGAGTAVLAQIGARISNLCEGLAPITVTDRPDGATCATGADCASGRCGDSPFDAPNPSAFAGVCLGCDGSTCGAGEVCGAGEPLSPALAVPLACVPAGAREIAEQCATDAECASGICSDFNLCSSCNTNIDCGGGLCGVAWVDRADDEDFNPVGPAVCRPGERANPPGTACGTDADCASDSCSGSERKVCFDGRACTTPADCPSLLGLAPSACVSVGIQGGTCD